MDIDKRTLLAFVLIFLVIMVVQYYYASKQPIPKKLPETETVEIESPKTSVSEDKSEIAKPPAADSSYNTTIESPFNIPDGLMEQDIVIETQKFRAIISNKGGTIKSWRLKEYAIPNSGNNGDRIADDNQVELIGPLPEYSIGESEKGFGNLGIYLPVRQGEGDTSPLLFEFNKTKIELEEGDNADTLQFSLWLKNGGHIVKKYIFYPNSYDFDLEIEFENITDEILFQPYYRLEWQSGMASTEIDIKDDMDYAKAFILAGSELTEEDIPEEGESYKPTIGKINWIAAKTKYFASAIVPMDNSELKGFIKGDKYLINPENEIFWKKFNLALEVPVNSGEQISSKFKIFIGPLDFFVLNKYDFDLEKIVYLGWSWLRPLSIGILYSFVFLHKFITNYGVVIIIFSILVKILLYPLTKKSMDSMKGMQDLKPDLDQIKEKYGNDPQRMNKETMRLYKERGINPAAGCLPMVLQFPILIALYNVFRTTIELRGEPFFGWITDLSMPDTIFHLPFDIPFYGDQFNVLPIIMGITMFLQQKMTMQDPKQKAMVYIMPVFFTALFNRFSSGLNLYYTLFNLFSVIQQKYFPTMHKQNESQGKSTPIELKKNNKKDTKQLSGKSRRRK
ncbi:membrane protein insertase YidC [candidate division KSB1 bacterium]|nr:membrane protein insertase YidC [candidate division KSB1 bacterium]